MNTPPKGIPRLQSWEEVKGVSVRTTAGWAYRWMHPPGTRKHPPGIGSERSTTSTVAARPVDVVSIRPGRPPHLEN